MNILSILSLIQTLFFFSRGASYLYVDDIQNAFNNPLDAQIGNGTSKVLRSTTNTINHGLKIPYNFMVGVSDFDMPNTGFMDFALYNSTYINSSTTLKVDVFPNNGFYTLSYQVWVAMNGKIVFQS